MFDPIAPKENEFVRPRDLLDTTKPEVLYARSYLLMRGVVGAVGLALPIRHSGQQAVETAVNDALAPFTGDDGRVTLPGWFRVVLTR